jgi:orotate phosphoribosyltransferase
VVAASYLRGAFVLGSLGQTSVYFDKYLFVTKPAILRRLATHLSALVDRQVDRVGGAELGGVALATVVSLELGLPFVIVRRDGRGDRLCEGELSPGDGVTLIEDVVATGRHALTSVERLRERGALVREVISVVDRREGASTLLEAAGCQLKSLFSLSEEEKR